jgi:hypothetical protein
MAADPRKKLQVAMMIMLWSSGRGVLSGPGTGVVMIVGMAVGWPQSRHLFVCPV